MSCKLKTNLQTYENIDLKSEQSEDWLPLVIESGHPGCNMNYPICSILYPKSPFLANYPFSLKFKHLHEQVFKISSITIERIGKHKCANEIKSGSIHFENSCGAKSKEYEFAFDPEQDRI